MSDKCIVDVFQIDNEFMRISTVPLLSTFFAELDQHSPRMMELFREKGGVAGKKIRQIMVAISKVCIKLCKPMLMKYFLCPCHDNCMSVNLYVCKQKFQESGFPFFRRMTQYIQDEHAS